LCRGIGDSKKVYQRRTNIVKDEWDNLVTDSHSTFSQLVSLHEANDVRQTEIHTTEPLLFEASVLEFEMAIEKLIRHKSPGNVQTPAELNKLWGKTNRSEIH
jgi:hypothetical protein